MRKETNKGKMLAVLFDSPKTTAELAYELGYVSSEGIARYNVINKDLKKLVESKYIKSEKVKKEQKYGNVPTLYSINYDIHSLRNMLEKHPYLISTMQKKESVFEVILREYPNLIRRLNEEEHRKNNENTKSFTKIEEESLKKRWQLSTEYFKYFIDNDENKLVHCVLLLAKISDEKSNMVSNPICDNLEDRYLNLNDTISNDEETSNEHKKISKGKINFGLDVAFKACVIKDIMDGQLNTEAIEYIKEMKNELFDEQIEKLKNNYLENGFLSDSSKSEKLISIKNHKSREAARES